MTETQPVEALASDDRLLALTKRGNRAAFPQLWTRYVASARLFASRLVGPSAADDVVSDAFVTAYRAAVEGKIPQGNFRHYIFVIIRDRAVENNGVTTVDSESIPSGGQEADAITRAFFSMDRRHRAALWLGEVEGLSTSEIALKMNERAAMAVALKVQAKGQFTQLVEEYNGGPISDPDDDPQSEIPPGATARDALTRGINQSPLGVALLRGVVGASPRGWATPGLQELLGGDDGIIIPSGMPIFGDGSSSDSESVLHHAPLFAPKVSAPRVPAGVTPGVSDAVPQTPTAPAAPVEAVEPVEANPSEPLDGNESGDDDDSGKGGLSAAGPLGAAEEVAPAGKALIDAELEEVKPLSIHDWLSSLNEDFEDNSSASAKETTKQAAPQPTVPVKPVEPAVPVKPVEPVVPVKPIEPVESADPLERLALLLPPELIPEKTQAKPEEPNTSEPVVEQVSEKATVKGEESVEPVEVAAKLDEDETNEAEDWTEDSTQAHTDLESIDLAVLSSDDAQGDKGSYVISMEDDDETDEYDDDDDWEYHRTKKKGGWGWLKIALPILVVLVVLFFLVKCAVDAGNDPTQSPSATVSQTTGSTPTTAASTQAPTEPTTAAPTEPTTGPTTVAPPVVDIKPIIVTSVDSGPQNICGPRLEGTATPGDTLMVRTGFGEPIQVEVGADGSWAMASNAQVTNPSVRDYTVLIGGQQSPRIQVNVTQASAPGAWVSVVKDTVKISGSGLLAGMKVQYAVDGVDLGIADTGSGSVETEFTQTLLSGEHVLTARYYQEQGCSGPAASYPFTVA